MVSLRGKWKEEKRGTMKKHKEVLAGALEREDVREEYDALDLEFEIRRALLYLRNQINITQRELAERLNTKQEYISRIERGHVALTIPYFAKLLRAMDAEMEISLYPRNGNKEVIKTRIPVA